MASASLSLSSEDQHAPHPRVAQAIQDGDPEDSYILAFAELIPEPPEPPEPLIASPDAAALPLGEGFDDVSVQSIFVVNAIPVSSSNEEELFGSEECAIANPERTNPRGQRKWIKKRGRARRRKRGRRRTRRRSDTSVQETHLPPPMVPSDSSSDSAVVISITDELYDEDGHDVDATVATEAEKNVDGISLWCQAVTELDQRSVNPEAMPDDPNGFSSKPKAKSDKCRLSSATAADETVFNDTLKIVMVGDCQMKTTLAWALLGIKEPVRPQTNLRVDVHPWTRKNINFSIWDVQGAAVVESSIANSCPHPFTQAIFYSPNSLYILVWDLAVNNEKTQRRCPSLNYDECQLELANREADRVLESDIYDNVLSWVDVIPGRKSAILPVVTISNEMDQDEVNRRCETMQAMLAQHLQGKVSAPSVVCKNECVLQVDLNVGVEELQATIMSIVTEKSDCALDHVGAPVSSTTVEVMETIRRLKQDHKVILIDHLLTEMNVIASVEDVAESLHFLSCIGEFLYFGSSHDKVLSRYIILSHMWLVSALSCIFRNDLKSELLEIRRLMNLQCAYSGQVFPENAFAHTLLCGSNSSCPVLSSIDSSMLWQSMRFMREAADRTAQLSEVSSTSTMFDFLERLVVHAKVCLPLTVPLQFVDRESSTMYFVPSLLSEAEPSRHTWTYKSSVSWKTTLCHSWLLRDGAPSTTMEFVTIMLLQDLYEFSNSSQGLRSEPLEHWTTRPRAPSSLNECIKTHSAQAIGRIKIHHVMCWKSYFLVKIGCIFADSECGKPGESVTEVFVSLVDRQSSHCVSSDSMGSRMKRLIVCGKGQVGHHGIRLWEGGYGLVLKSIKNSVAHLAKVSVAHLAKVDRQVVCPKCLAHFATSGASTWSWDEVVKAAKSGSAGIRCNRSHEVDPNLLCSYYDISHASFVPDAGCPVTMPVLRWLGSVVLVGCWDACEQKIHSVGSGFVADKELGLIVTAGHIFFDMDEGPKFGTSRVDNPKAVIAVIPDDGDSAVFRYFAEIVEYDIPRMDACILRISTRMENDVEGEGDGCALQRELPFFNDKKAIVAEKLQQLNMTLNFELDETVRILGYNQGFKEGQHVNRCGDHTRGYICSHFTRDCSSLMSFSPPEEIVVINCITVCGHSGGPCVNNEGMVVGILSRADAVERSRCYLVPASELQVLVARAEESIAVPPGLRCFS